MGHFISGRSRTALGGLEILCCPCDSACAGLPRADGSDPAAKRAGGRYCRRIWRLRQPDGVWAARRRDVFVARHHVVRRHVYVHLDGPGRTRKNGQRRNRPFDPRTILEAGSEICRSRAHNSVAIASGTAAAGSTCRASSCGARARARKVAQRFLQFTLSIGKCPVGTGPLRICSLKTVSGICSSGRAAVCAARPEACSHQSNLSKLGRRVLVRLSGFEPPRYC